MKTEENDLTRFCKHCGTELFFLDRFPNNDSKGVKQVLSYFKIKKLWKKHSE